MKRKCIVAIVSIISMSFVTACGQSGTSAPVVEQSGVEAEVTPVTEEASSEAVATKEPTEELEATVASPDEGESVTEEATEDTANDEAIWTGELTEEYALAKLQRISDAYDILMNQNGDKKVELNSIISMLPNIDIDKISPIEGLTTKDGIDM